MPGGGGPGGRCGGITAEGHCCTRCCGGSVAGLLRRGDCGRPSASVPEALWPGRCSGESWSSRSGEAGVPASCSRAAFDAFAPWFSPLSRARFAAEAAGRGEVGSRVSTSASVPETATLPCGAAPPPAGDAPGVGSRAWAQCFLSKESHSAVITCHSRCGTPVPSGVRGWLDSARAGSRASFGTLWRYRMYSLLAALPLMCRTRFQRRFSKMPSGSVSGQGLERSGPVSHQPAAAMVVARRRASERGHRAGDARLLCIETLALAGVGSTRSLRPARLGRLVLHH